MWLLSPTAKGGLIGKHILAFNNLDGKIKKLIAIATPFGGSHAAKLIPHKPAKELHPKSEIIKTLQAIKMSIAKSFQSLVFLIIMCGQDQAAF